ncbi:enoyl-CoA hydratase/isomerase family protein [bacterium]|nr:enoyl-CoA hydratase/isomerase family protein [bacterium]
MTYETILYQENDHIGLLTLNRPRTINALNQTMIEELEDLLNKLNTSATARVLILTGAGEKGFCSGMDMKETASTLFEASPEMIYQAQSRASQLFSKLRYIPQPIIAAIHGAASGVGFSFAMASDVRVITPEARFNAAYINIGLGGADMASSYFLPRLIGAGRANELLLTGDFLSSEDAMCLGFVSRVVPKDSLLDTAYEIAGKMTGKNPLGLKMTKEAININLGVSTLEQALHLENRNQSFLITALKINTP